MTPEKANQIAAEFICEGMQYGDPTQKLAQLFVTYCTPAAGQVRDDGVVTDIIAMLHKESETLRAGLELIACDWVGPGTCPKCGMEHAAAYPNSGEDVLRGFARYVLGKAPKTTLAGGGKC